MRRISAKVITRKQDLKLDKLTTKLSQKGMAYKTVFPAFHLFRKGAFLRLTENQLWDSKTGNRYVTGSAETNSGKSVSAS